MTVLAGKSTFCRVGWQAGAPGESCSVSLKVVFWQNSFLENSFEGGHSVYRKAFH